MSKYLISCGGTGGHLSPGIALAEGLAARGHEAVLLVSQKKVDSRLLEKYPHLRFERLPGTGFSLNPMQFLKCIGSQARAFLQRPAALALARVSAALRLKGYGLLVFDGYRPWSVTKMFWDATPDDKHLFVANPADGSKHNRGEAVDLSLYDLATGAPVDMVSTYDETTDRAAADYAGGTSRQRWHRALLRRAMEAERFNVIVAEWWHFDFAEWREYGIGNVPFEQIH